MMRGWVGGGQKQTGGRDEAKLTLKNYHIICNLPFPHRAIVHIESVIRAKICHFALAKQFPQHVAIHSYRGRPWSCVQHNFGP